MYPVLFTEYIELHGYAFFAKITKPFSTHELIEPF